MPLPDGFLQELKFKTDINDVVSTYVTLKNAEIPMSVCVRFIMKNTVVYRLSGYTKLLLLWLRCRR